MAFRKRNIGISSGSPRVPDSSSSSQPPTPQLPGTRSSPLDGRLTTSTGTPPLDSLLAGHAGLVLGSSLIIEETGTTDFAGSLLRYYAAEGVVQGHIVHVVGVGQQWGRTLPGLIGMGEGGGRRRREKGEKMKIAWRYERLGEFKAVAGARDKQPLASPTDPTSTPPSFSHAFDLTTRLTHPNLSTINYIPLPPSTPNVSLYTSVLQNLSTHLSSTTSTTVHRLVIPSLLSPALYPPQASNPTQLLQFLHTLRSLLSVHSTRLTAMITLPLSLYPRSTGLVRWIELLSDGVLELAPFPHSSHISTSNSTFGASTSEEEPPQGMLKIHRLPIFHEIGAGRVDGMTEDWAFTLSRRKFDIKPFSLPPVEGDNEAQRGEVTESKPKAVDMEF